MANFNDGNIQQLADLQQTFGRTGIGNIITNAPINKWARNKPFRSTSKNFSTDDGSSGTYLTDREKARAAALYGFASNPNVSSTTDCPALSCTGANLSHNDSSWAYNRPDGSTYPFRHLDFLGYRHDAIPGFKVSLSDAQGRIHHDSLNNVMVYFGAGKIPGCSASDCIEPYDIVSQQCKQMYVGLLFMCADYGSRVYFLSSGKTMAECQDIAIPFYFAGQSISGAGSVPYVIISDLAPRFAQITWFEHTVTIAAALAPSNGYSQANTLYTVSNNGTLGGQVFRSLEFNYNLDRKYAYCAGWGGGVDFAALTGTESQTPSNNPTLSTASTDILRLYYEFGGYDIRLYAGDGWTEDPQGATIYYYKKIIVEEGSGFSTTNSISGNFQPLTGSGSLTVLKNTPYFIGFSLQSPLQYALVATSARHITLQISVAVAATPIYSLEDSAVAKIFTFTHRCKTW